MLTAQQKIGDIVLENINVAAVFDEYGFDYRCHGNIRLADACKIGFIDGSKVVRDIKETSKGDSLRRIAQGKTEDLIDYIIEHHHGYVKRSTPAILLHLANIAALFGTNYPVLHEAHTVFSRIARDIHKHTAKEENILFSSIKTLVECSENNLALPVFAFGSVTDLVAALQYEHEVAGNEMIKIRQIVKDLATIGRTEAAIASVCKELQDFERDLDYHILLENYVLFPRAANLEKELRSANQIQ